jgi:hypothetical protein
VNQYVLVFGGPALNDVSEQARVAITIGKAPCFCDEWTRFNDAFGRGNEPSDFLRKHVRVLAEECRMCVPFQRLYKPRSEFDNAAEH